MSADLSRRTFVASTTAATLVSAPGILSAQGANSKINIGWIGTGSRGNHVMDMMYKSGVKDVVVTAVCDTYDGHRNRAVDRVATWGGNKPKPYIDYRDLLADPSIDIVFICTPEHLHYQMAVDAMLAGKHIYLEKPLAHTIEEGEDLLKISRKSKRIVQVGTQNRSNSLYIKAKEMVQQGMIGEIHYVRAFWYRN